MVTTLDLIAIPDEFVSAVEMLSAARGEVRRLQDQGMAELAAFKTKVRAYVAEQDRNLNDEDDAEAFLADLGLPPLRREFQVIVPVSVTFVVRATDEDAAKDEAKFTCALDDRTDYSIDWWSARASEI